MFFLFVPSTKRETERVKIAKRPAKSKKVKTYKENGKA
jgi:hypothetical protein